MELSTKEIVEKISQVIYDKKGINILGLDVSHFSTITDFLVIAEGNVERHVIAIAHEIVKELRDTYNIRPHHVEGLAIGDWVLLDYCDVIVHLFMPGLRDKFSLESLWSEGIIVDLSLSLAN